VPGPACYDQGGEAPTNTDANLVLGILSPRGLLGGRKPLSLERAREAIATHVAEPLGLTVEQAAIAIHTVQNAQTGDLLRKTVVEAGHDPRAFVLYAFGGAGPAHCARYAAEIGVSEVVVPLGPVASGFSAYGLASSDIVLTAERSAPTPIPFDPAVAESILADLEARARADLDHQGVRFADIRLERELDLRYTMQLAEVTVPLAPGTVTSRHLDDVVTAFETRYEAMYGKGSGFREAGVQAITFRVRGVGMLPFDPKLPQLAPADGPDPSGAQSGVRPVCLDAAVGFAETPIYDYTALRSGHVLTGPAIVEVPTTTVVVPPGSTGTVDGLGNLVIRPEGSTS
jgi:N-methylhydantoinase A